MAVYRPLDLRWSELSSTIRGRTIQLSLGAITGAGALGGYSIGKTARLPE